MAKYLVSACYTAEGLKGLTKDKAAKRKQAIEQALATSASGLVRTRTVPLLTPAELDEALAKQVAYRAPGA